MRFPKSLAACAIALATFAVATAVGAGPVLAGVANPPPAPPLTFPTIQLDTEPSGVAVDPTTHMVYVANPQNDGNGLVSVIDAADDFSPPVLLEQLRLPGDPTAIGVDTSTHIVYAAGNNGLTMINAATIPPTVGSVIPLGGDQNLPGQVAVDSATHTVYVTEFGANDVKVVDTAVNPPTVTTIGYPEIVDTPLGVAVDPTTNLAYVTEINDDLLAVIDGADNPPRVVHTIHLGDPATINNGGADPDAVGVDPTTHTLYVSNGNGTPKSSTATRSPQASLSEATPMGWPSTPRPIPPTSPTVPPTPSRWSATPRALRPSRQPFPSAISLSAQASTPAPAPCS